MQSRREELYKIMKEAKMYSLPTTCPCGYVAKKNWIEMEVHYDKCAQFRSVIKKENVSKIKSGLEAMQSLEELVPMLRKMEIDKKNSGYAKLIQYKSKFPPDVYEFIEACLDNPDKDYKINIDYKINLKK